MSPGWQQKKLREFCAQKGIVVTAYSPLGAKGTAWGTNRVMDNGVLREIANAKGKTVAQVCVCVYLPNFMVRSLKRKTACLKIGLGQCT